MFEEGRNKRRSCQTLSYVSGETRHYSRGPDLACAAQVAPLCSRSPMPELVKHAFVGPFVFPPTSAYALLIASQVHSGQIGVSETHDDTQLIPATSITLG